MVKLSIAIPTYNRASFLAETLDTILPQIQKGMEVVVSDNGSTDDTLKCLKQYQERYPIRVVGFQQNQGIDKNILHVIQQSRGEYIQLFADDDLLMPHSLERIMEEIEQTAPLVLCLNHFAFQNHRLEERQPPFLPFQRKTFFSGEAFFTYCGLGFLSSLVFRRDHALSLLHHVRLGKECAHLDIVSRIVLQQRGSYVFLGDVTVAGRALYHPRYDMMHSCVLYPKELYDELLDEKLLSLRAHRRFLRKLLYKEVPRIVYKMMQRAQPFSLRELLGDHFKVLRESWWMIACLEGVNTRVLRRIFDMLFLGVKLYRRVRLW